MNKPPESPPTATPSPTAPFNIDQSIADEMTIYSNLGHEILVTTTDKVKLCLIEHQAKVNKSRSFETPLAIFLTLLTAFQVTKFEDRYFSAPTWEAIFLLLTVFSFIWLCRSSYRAFRSRKGRDIDELITQLKLYGTNQDTD